MGFLLQNGLFAIRIEVFGLIDCVFAIRSVVYAIMHADFAIMDVVYAIIIVKYESMNGVYDGINVDCESINCGLDGRFGVYEAKNVLLWRRLGAITHVEITTKTRSWRYMIIQVRSTTAACCMTTLPRRNLSGNVWLK